MPYYPIVYNNPYPRPTDWDDWMRYPGRPEYKLCKNENRARKKELRQYQERWDEYDASLKAQAEKEYYRYQPATTYYADKLLASGLTEEQVDMLRAFIVAVIDDERPQGANQHE